MLNRLNKPENRAVYAQEIRALLKLGLPLAATQLAQMAVMTTDTLMIARLGSVQLAAAAVGFTFYVFSWLVASGPVMAISPVIAQAIGHDPSEIRGVRRALRMGFWATLLTSLPIFALYALAPQALRLLHQKPAVISLAAPYIAVLAPGLLFNLGYMSLRNFLSALGHTRTPLLIGVGLIALNAVLDYGLIYGHFGLPRLEMIGAGLATSIANIAGFSALLAFVLLAPTYRKFKVLSRFWRPDWQKLRELFRIGLPIAITMAFEITLFQAGTIMMGMIGTAELAANQIAMNVASITFMVPLGLAMGGTVRVGLAAGAQDRDGARRAAFVTIALGSAFMALCGAHHHPFPARHRDALPQHPRRIECSRHRHRGDVPRLRSAVPGVRCRTGDGGLCTARSQGTRAFRQCSPASAIGWSGFRRQRSSPSAPVWAARGIWIGYVAGLFAAAVLLLVRVHLMTRTRA